MENGCVRQILDELLQDICSPCGWKQHCVDKPGLPQTTALSTAVEQCQHDAGPFFDICEMIYTHCPKNILTNFSVLDGRCEIMHLKCVEQMASGYCGHYAVYFSLCCLEASLCRRRDDALWFLQQNTSTVGLWRRYWTSVGQLLMRVSEGNGHLWWPWTEDHVVKGDMERSYLNHLLSADPHILSVGGTDRISVLHFAYGRFQNAVEEIDAIQRRIDCFRSSQPSCMMFLLGVTNHWVTAMAYTDRDGQRGLLYLDSNNTPLLTASNGEIVDIVEEKNKKRLQKKGRGFSEWKRGIMYQAFTDQRDVVHLLAQVLFGSKRLSTEVLTNNWTQLLESFRVHVEEPLAGLREDDVFMALMLQWLECQYHPQTLRDVYVHELRQLGAHCLQQSVAKRLKTWVSRCQQNCEGGIDIIDNFLSVLKELDDVL